MSNPDILNIIKGAVDSSPTAVQSAFQSVIQDKLAAAIDARYEELTTETYGEFEDEDLDEAVEIKHDRYIRSHGKKARDTSGPGNWMFTHKAMGDVDYKNEKEVHEVRGKFADAKKSAKEWAKKHGHAAAYVMEEVEQLDELSRKTLGSYVKKASTDMWRSGSDEQKYKARANKAIENSDVSSYRNKTAQKYRKKADDSRMRAAKREIGIEKAADRLMRD